ncbi:hypothetical protein [Nocardia brasiliensis]|uniref:hypothetical protein n=1 Tax=Nocardia brasiliensis TaxID=37326 RepID=UPI002457EE0E|nr:hypothetical protein [Nocardia brasiliensis]
MDGQAFGRILAANDHYRQAIETNSRTTVSGICYGDASAQCMAVQLWKSGIDTEVYSFKTGAYTFSIGSTATKADASALTAVAYEPGDEQHFADPITHHAPPTRQARGSP